MADQHKYGSNADVSPPREAGDAGDTSSARTYGAPDIGGVMGAAHDAITTYHNAENSVHPHKLPAE